MDAPTDLFTAISLAGAVFAVTFALVFAVSLVISARRRRVALAKLADAAGLAGARWRETAFELGEIRAFAASEEGRAAKPVLDQLARLSTPPHPHILLCAPDLHPPARLRASLDQMRAFLSVDPVGEARRRIHAHFAPDLVRAAREGAVLEFDDASRRALDANLVRLIEAASGFADQAEQVRGVLRPVRKR
ncbi:MAG: hypothetical protein ACFE0P_13950 [Oceanicaulis sp.]